MKLHSDDSVNVVVCGIWSLLWISQLIKSIAGVMNDVINNRILTPLRIQSTDTAVLLILCENPKKMFYKYILVT